VAKEKVSQELIGLIRLISFFKQLRHKKTQQETGFYFVNELYNLVKYRQCILWLCEGKKVKPFAGSGQVDVSSDAPISQFLSRLLEEKIQQDNISSPPENGEGEEEFVKIKKYSFADFKDLPDRDIKEFIAPHVTSVFLYDSRGLLGGAWIDHNSPVGEMEEAVISDAADALAIQLQHFKKSQSFSVRSLKTSKTLILAAVVIFLLWPVRFSSTGEAEIIAKEIDVISAPFNGLIKEVHVAPNDQVKREDLILSLDKTELSNDYAVSLQKLETAIQKLEKTEREAFQDTTKNAEISILKQEIKLADLEVNYAENRLSLADIKAPNDGVVLFSDKNDLIGKPVQAGQTALILANKKDLELLIRIPVKGMIGINEEIPVEFFLNTDPLKSYKAKIYNISYKPAVDPDGLMTYKARAYLSDEEKIEKIGLTGTAKIYGDRTIMLFNILRRPFIALRNLSSF